MDCVKRLAAIAVAAVAGLSMPAHAAEPTTNAAPAAATKPALTPRQTPVVRNGGVHRVNPAASAASDPRDDVQTTVEEGRTTTRNAHPRAEGGAVSAPND